jgi:gliding motility-associated-like protein
MFREKKYQLFNGVNFLLMLIFSFKSFAQPTNDGCFNAEKICPSLLISGTTVNASATACPNCEDDFSFCFTSANSVWYEFKTNTIGGNVTINFSNLNFIPQATRGSALDAVLVQATVPCDAGTFTQIGNCAFELTSNFQINAVGLPANTTYYIIVNGSKNGGATLPANATFDLLVSGTGFDRPALDLTMSNPGLICPDYPVYLAAYLTNCQDTSQFTWYVNGTLTSSNVLNTWTTSSLNQGDVVSVSCSCFTDCPVNLTSNLVNINEVTFNVDAGPDQSTSVGTEISLIGSSDGDSVQWVGENPIFNSTTVVATVIPYETETYILTAYKNGCILTDEVTVTVDNLLTIPGSFSPNGDGVNDKWIIEGIENYPNCLVWIYDRWGQEVATVSSYSLNRAWNGTNNGKAISDGVYFYSIDLNDKSSSKLLKGNVTIIR